MTLQIATPFRAVSRPRSAARSLAALAVLGLLLVAPTPGAAQEAAPAAHQGDGASKMACGETKEGATCPMHGGSHGAMQGEGSASKGHGDAAGSGCGMGEGAEGGQKGHTCGGGRMQKSDGSGSPPTGEARGRGMRHRRGGMGDGPGMGNHGVMRTAMTLVHQHRDAIEREVEDIENGVVTTTWSALDPEAARMLERHVVEMKAALEAGQRVRGWDPLFAEIFDHYDEIEMVVERIEGGVRVTETSDNPEVVKLIQAHARKVNDFLEHGPAAVHAETPLPEGYVDTRPR